VLTRGCDRIESETQSQALCADISGPIDGPMLPVLCIPCPSCHGRGVSRLARLDIVECAYVRCTLYDRLSFNHAHVLVDIEATLSLPLRPTRYALLLLLLLRFRNIFGLVRAVASIEFRPTRRSSSCHPSGECYTSTAVDMMADSRLAAR